MKYNSLIVVFVGLLAFCNARRVSESEVVSALTRAGADVRRMNIWKCIVREESNFETTAYNPVTKDYGIFQISALYWCKEGNKPGKGCHVSCNSLLDDDISKDAKCAVLIYNDAVARIGEGFQPWTTFSRCRNA